MREVRHQLPGGWTVTYEVGPDLDGNPAIIGVVVRPTEPDSPPAGGLTAQALRRIPTGRIVARTWADVTNSGTTYAELTASGATYADVTHTAKPDYSPRRGRTHDPGFLLLVAQAWEHVLLASSDRNLYDALVVELRRQGYEYRRGGARQLVANAREAGLLKDPAKPRGPTGGLTAKAQRLLQG